MKKKSKILATILLIVMCFSIHLDVSAAIKQLTLKATVTYKIVQGEEMKLYVKGHKNDRKVRWKSSNKKIATVSKTGKVKGLRGGSCKITAKVEKKKYKVNIIVFSTEEEIHEYDLDDEPIKNRTDFGHIELSSINATEKTLFEGQTFSLKITGTNEKITWQSSDTNIADVSSDGLVTAKQPGTVKINGSFKDENYIYDNSCDITVTPVWMNEEGLEKNYGITCLHLQNSVKIIGITSEDSITGSTNSVLISNIPESMLTDQIYGTDVTYKYDGTNLLFNVSDLHKLNIL